MVRKLISTIALALCCLLATAQNKGYDCHWLNMGITEDLSTSAVISWASYNDAEETIAQIAPMCINPKVNEKASNVEVRTIFVEGREVDGRTYPDEYWHRAWFKDLQPETQYLYRVGDGHNWSEWCEFKTAAKGDKPFKFIYFGDVQKGMEDVYPRIARKAFTAAPDAAFVTFVGDLTNGRNHSEFNSFFEANDWMIRQMPVAAVADGHEHQHNFEEMIHLWEHMFAYPGNAPKQAKKEGMYYFDCQDCRFISVDASYFHSSREGLDEAFAWLEEILKNNPCTWTVIAQHQPFYSTGRGGRKETVEFKKPLKELYSKYGVDLVLSAHDHQYSRFSEKKNGKPVIPIETVSQAGGKCYIPIYNSHADRIATGTQNYQIVEVSNKQLVYKAYMADGSLYDSFIIKNKNGKKKFVDATPDVPEKTDLDYTTSYDKEAEAAMLKKKAAYEAKKK